MGPGRILTISRSFCVLPVTGVEPRRRRSLPPTEGGDCVAKSNPTVAKRNRERANQERQQEKRERRAQRGETKKERDRSLEDGVDPDLIGIFPGPQPQLDEEY